MEQTNLSITIGETRRELLLSPLPDDPPSSMDVFHDHDDDDDSLPSWRLSLTEFRFPPRDHRHSRFSCRHLLSAPRKESKIAEYYQKQESLLEGYNEIEAMTESGCFPGSLTEDEMKQLAKSERFAVHISNIANIVLFIAKVYASTESRSLAVIASTLDSFLDLLSGFILWFTAKAMRNPNHYHYPIGKKRMQPVGIIVFASVMATLGLQILLESFREIISKASDIYVVRFSMPPANKFNTEPGTDWFTDQLELEELGFFY